jgi:hypothetical protein
LSIQYAPGLKAQEQPEGSLDMAREGRTNEGKHGRIRAANRSRRKARLKVAVAVVIDCILKILFALEADLGGN